ncbi:GNAT family N-acetyltransferase [Aurantimonas sp. 22II-16-19i]|uniref:GNAT family N-acetyltransferase n=1 Tax=Aurantimonas sp. 22II-16-19i TaxID=1317114 RepID=UPI0009F801F2|nr:GNAT family N-acetyltransferase [Aurantimonas sp. 22II-16-19i]ORE86736.1 cellulose biosynthesis protein CelD [Aurantimonas sp. 22II-16-19i]
MEHDVQSGDFRSTIISASRYRRLRNEWQALSNRALVPNVFASPEFAAAADKASPRNVHVILAWRDRSSADRAELVGVLLVTCLRSPLSWPTRLAVSPVSHLAYLGSPVLHRNFVSPALQSMLCLIRDHRWLPKLVEIGDLSAELLDDLLSVAAGHQMSVALVERRQRAKLVHGEAGPKVEECARSRQRAFERRRKKLARSGTVTVTDIRGPDLVVAHMEEFLELEASGWKGKRGTALLSDPVTAALSRHAVRDLAKTGNVSIHTIRLDGKVLAMGIIFYAGPHAFTWRTAYDESYAPFSPGLALLEWTSEQLLADPRLTMTDSCNHRDTGMQAERWAARHELLDVLIDVRPRRRATLDFLAAKVRGRRRIKEMLRRLRDRLLAERRDVSAILRRIRGRPPYRLPPKKR